MPPKSMMKFVDLGSGMFGRAVYLATRHPRTKLVAVDKEKPSLDIINRGLAADGKPPLLENIGFVGQDARKYLEKQDPATIDILNMDLSARTKSWVKKYSGQHAKMFINADVTFFREAFRKLAPRGRVYLTVYRSQVDGILQNLHKAGFQTRHKPLAELPRGSVKGPYSLSTNMDISITDGEIHDLVRIEAKKPIIGEPKK